MYAEQLTDALSEAREGMTWIRETRSALADLPDWARTTWPGRALLDAGKNEEALGALWAEIQMGCPWYLMQARYLAEARLERFLEHPEVAIERLCSAASAPENDHWDPDLYMQAIYEIATFDAGDSRIESAIQRSEWAHLAFEAADALTSWQLGEWWDEPKQSRLRATIADAASGDASVEFERDPESRHDPKSAWPHYITDPDHEIMSRDDWQEELTGLEESLDVAVAMSEFNDAAVRRPFADDVAALWRDGDPARTAADVSAVLLDAYRPRDTYESDSLSDHMAWPDAMDRYAQTELEALLVRAHVALGNPDAADAAYSRAFTGYKEASGWVIQLATITNGRVLASLGDVDRAFDQLWESVRHFNSSQGDFDLALEALCELALLDHVSPRHPSPVEWALVAQAMAGGEGAWSPAPWYQSLRPRIDRIARSSRSSTPHAH